MSKGKKRIRYFTYWLQGSLLASGAGTFIFCNITNQYTGMLYGLWLVWISNVVWGCVKYRERLLFLLFHVAYATFFMVRPLIEVYRNYRWWRFLGYSFSITDLKFALSLLLIGLFGLQIGGMLGFICSGKKGRPFFIGFQYHKDESKPLQRQYIKYLGAVSLVLTLFSAAAYIYINTCSYIWSINNGGYTASYVGVGPYIPHLVQILAIMFKYTTIVYLTTFPSKKNAYAILGLYVFAECPALLMGNRGAFVLRVLFAFVYFCIRDFSKDDEKWIGRFEKNAIIIGMPICIIFLSVYNYIRDGLSLMSYNIFMIISDFFYKQGVSFCTLCLFHKVMPLLKEENFINFSFGEIIDYWIHGAFAQRFFGARGLPSSNSIELATISNNLGHRISYLISKNEYLAGHGYGSSYLLEGYADWGIAGAFVLSILLGITLTGLLYWIGKNRLLDIVLLYIISNIFFIPRAEFTLLVSFLTQVQFWIALGLCFGGASLMVFFRRKLKS